MKLLTPFKRAMLKSEKNRPESIGFPYLAECLREEGFIKNIWYLPSGDSFYLSKDDSLVIPGKSLIEEVTASPYFSKEKLINSLRADQAGQTTFLEFLLNIWESGVVKYEVNFNEHYVVYFGIRGEQYKEHYPEVEINEDNIY